MWNNWKAEWINNKIGGIIQITNSLRRIIPLKKNKKAVLCIILLALVILCIRTYNKIGNYRIQKEISRNIIRFHVRANSDSEDDQNLKLKVRDSVVAYMETKLENAESLDEARNILYYCKDEIECIAHNKIIEEGYNYPVKVYFEQSFFPMKTYGDMVFPAGRYEAFRIDIGNSEGKNWWCVLFPPLCFVDSTYAVVPDGTKDKFHKLLSEEAYGAITMSELDNNYEIRFKYLTFLNGLIE